MTTIYRDFDNPGAQPFQVLTCDVLTADPAELAMPSVQTGVALGFFDGVHIGHRELIRTLVYHCAAEGLDPTVFTMDRYPKPRADAEGRSIFKGLIQSTRDKLDILCGLGVARTYIQSFTPAFADLPPEVFLDTVLYERLGVRLIVVGSDFRFGRLASGDVGMIRVWAAQRGVRLIVVEPIRSGGRIVSSTVIREAIADGQFETVSHLLGCDYSIRGPVMHGNALGRTMGMPTANVALPEDLLLPPFGVYVTRTRVGSRIYNSVTNIGRRPTVNSDETSILMETAILDAELQLYGKMIEVMFLKFLRPEQKFHSFLALTAQMQRDSQNTRDWLAAHEQLWKVYDEGGITTWLLPSDRFYSNVINIGFNTKADPVNSAAHMLLSRVLTACSAAYPTRVQMAVRLDELYGASLTTRVRSEGDWQTVLFIASAVNRGVDGSKPFHELLSLLYGAILQPKLDENGILDEAIVEQERRALLLELSAASDRRARYLLDRCRSLTCGLSAHAIPATGDIEAIERLTAAELTLAWHRWLRTAQIKVYVAGRVDAELTEYVIRAWESLKVHKKRSICLPGLQPGPFRPAEPVEVIETALVEQSRIALAYYGLSPYPSYTAGVVEVLNSMLGADSHSILNESARGCQEPIFQVQSALWRFLSTICMTAAVPPGREQEAVAFIDSRIRQIAKGAYDPQLFESSREIVKNQILAISDNMSRLMGFRRGHMACGRSLSIEDALLLIDEITPEQVSALAAGLRRQTTLIVVPDGRPAETVRGPLSGAAAEEVLS